MCKLYRTELGRREQEANAEILRCQSYIRLHLRRDSWWTAPYIWSAVPLVIRHGSGCYWCRHAENTHHGILLCLQLFYGLQHRSFPRYRKKYSANHHCYPWFLRIPYYLDLHSICTFPDDFGAVSSIYLLMGNYRTCGSFILCCHFQKNQDLTPICKKRRL